VAEQAERATPAAHERADAYENDAGTSGDLPRAVIRRERRISWAWIIPFAAIALAAWLGYSAYQRRGYVVVVHFPDGHGLTVGSDVRYHGIAVGEVRDVALDDDLEGVRVTLGLRSQAERIARAGSRFWIVRPQVSVTNVAGMETLLGSRYVAAQPTRETGRRQREFIGLAEPPVVLSVDPGDLQIILQAGQRGSLRRGVPVNYRQVQIGTVLSVGLASDGSRVEARVNIRKAYRDLIREGTRFWDTGGVRAKLGLGGFSFEMNSLDEVLAGGVGFATPPPEQAGEAVRTGHRFTLHAEPQERWLTWQPVVAVGSALLPSGAALPQPMRATIGWKQGFLVKGSHTRQGWVLQTEEGLIGPADLLVPHEATEEEGGVTLEVAGLTVSLIGEPTWSANGLAQRDLDVAGQRWRIRHIRTPEAAEDCIIVADPTAAPIPLSASRVTAEDGRWLIDDSLPIDETLHGACVLSRVDGRLVGMVLIESDDIVVALMPTDIRRDSAG
jgi:hypothetical protein